MCLVLFLSLGVTMATPGIGDAQPGAPPASSAAAHRVRLTVQVILDIFSGRPNPSWTLSADEERELALRLRGLPPGPAPAEASGLGYRGFRLVAPSAGSPLPPEMIVGDGTISVRDASGLRHYLDHGGVEAWLRDQARRHGYGTLFEGP